MSARRVIIDAIVNHDLGYPSPLDIANHVCDALTAAGYRLIGPGSVDDVAAAMWREEAIDSGTPASVAAGRTREAFDEQADGLKDKWRKFAAAALRALQSQEAGNEG